MSWTTCPPRLWCPGRGNGKGGTRPELGRTLPDLEDEGDRGSPTESYRERVNEEVRAGEELQTDRVQDDRGVLAGEEEKGTEERPERPRQESQEEPIKVPTTVTGGTRDGAARRGSSDLVREKGLVTPNLLSCREIRRHWTRVENLLK